MADIPSLKWNGKHVEIAPPKKPKKITGTRFATLLGLNPWSTPFEIWCAITRTYEKPFEDTIYTVAGKTIEPKQAKYMEEAYGMDNLVTPTDLFGKDYFSKTWGDFFHEWEVLGGMWDYLLYEDGKPTTVLEMKTTKRAEDWSDDVPEYYALQAALYAYMLNVDDVIMVCSFLSPSDYEHPDLFVPSASNTITVEFKVSERYPDFPQKVDQVLEWWDEHVTKGISPDYDEKRDEEILKVLRTNSLTPDTDIKALLKKADALQDKVNNAYAKIKETEDELEEVKKLIKAHATEQFRDGDKKVVVSGGKWTWEVSRSETKKIDEAALKKDGLLDRYKSKVAVTYKITAKKKEEEK